MNNIDRIKNMTSKEMAIIMGAKIKDCGHCPCYSNTNCNDNKKTCTELIQEWLERESE